MSREIKFRVWDKTTGYWSEGITLTLHMSGRLINVPPSLVLQQYTGLKDKEGKEVYEGDIVRSHNVFAPTTHIFEVFWREKFAGFFLKEMGKQDEQNTWVELMHGGNVTDLEVIGNIYEDGEM